MKKDFGKTYGDLYIKQVLNGKYIFNKEYYNKIKDIPLYNFMRFNRYNYMGYKITN